MITSPLLFRVLALLVVVTQSSAAQAEDPETLIRGGIQLRREGKDQEALDKFQQAYSLSPTPRALAQVGMAEHALGLWTDAEKHVRQALRATDDPWIIKNRSAMEVSLAVINTHIGQIQIVGSPSGAEVRIEGQLAGTLPMANPIPIAAGTAAVEVRAPEYLPASRVVGVSAGELSRETIVLQKVALSIPSTSASAGEPPRTDGPIDSVSRDGSWQRRLAWIALGGAGLFLAAGTTALIVRESNARWFTDPGHECDPTTASKGGPRCKEAYDRGQTAKTLGIAGLVAAGVLGAGSIALFLLAPQAGKGESAALRAVCAPYVAGLTCAVRF